MADYQKHISDTNVLYPVISAGVAALVLVVTGNSLVTLATLVVGYAFLVVGLTIPDTDSPSSIPKRRLDRAVTLSLAAVTGYWVLASEMVIQIDLAVDVGQLLVGLPDWFVFAVLLSLVVVWKSHLTTHRGLPHDYRWGLGMATLISAGVWFGLRGWAWPARLVVSASLAAYFVTGFLAHLDRDGELFGEGPSFREQNSD